MCKVLNTSTRLTLQGVHLDCYLTYSNTHSWLSPTPQLDWTMEIFPGNQNVRRFEAPVGFGKERMLIERVGIRVTFKQDGLLGHFSWLALLRTLTIGFMLFALIGFLLDAICTRFMPLAYKYEDAKYEFTENIYNLREVRRKLAPNSLSSEPHSTPSPLPLLSHLHFPTPPPPPTPPPLSLLALFLTFLTPIW
jgi:hypothetical protein